MNSEIFEKMPPTKLFFYCAAPAMVSMVSGSLFQIADGIFVGRFIGENALAAINLVMPIITIVFAVSNMIATGASVRISILLGEKKREEASAVFSFTLKAILAVSIVIGLIGYVFADPFVRVLAKGASEQAIEYSVTYTRVYAMFAPLLLIFFATDNFLRICGKQAFSMWIGIASEALNLILNVLFIVILRRGVAAAAFTSCVSMAMGSVLTLWAFRQKRMDLYYTRQNISLPVFLKIILNGSSEFFSNIAVSIMSVVYNLFLLKYGGTTAVAAFSVIMYVDGIVGMLIFGMCDAFQPVISYCLGAKRFDRVKAIMARVIVGSVILSGIAMLYLLFAGKYVAQLFVKPEDTELLKISVSAMKIFALSYLTGWVDTCFSSYFTALEKPVLSLVTSMVGTVVFPISFLVILTPLWQLDGVWYAGVFASFASAAVTLLLAFNLMRSGFGYSINRV